MPLIVAYCLLIMIAFLEFFVVIDGCVYRNAILKFRVGQSASDKNIYTTIVGRNGSGKSRLLRELVREFVSVIEDRRIRDIKEIKGMQQVFGLRPTAVIASSTSTFDKFPLPKLRVRGDGYYFYQGLRGLPNSNVSLAYMSRTMGFLIKALSNNPDRVGSVMAALRYLGYAEFIVASYVVDVPRNLLEIIENSFDPITEIRKLAMDEKQDSPDAHRFLYELGMSNYADRTLQALKDFSLYYKKPRLDVVLSSSGALELSRGGFVSEEFSLLIESGFVRLRDVRLHKEAQEKGFNINDASSGEQCIIMALLGIAAHIKDGALICIDEPEICLHPEWQEKYIEMLMETFKGFKRCHFIIATHSPQIISKLADDNCFILDMESSETFAAKSFNRRSADFQLANIFSAPGYKNEYLTREFLSALGTLGSGMEISADRLQNLHRFIKLKNKLEDSDPVKNLLVILESALKEKGV